MIRSTLRVDPMTAAFDLTAGSIVVAALMSMSTMLGFAWWCPRLTSVLRTSASLVVGAIEHGSDLTRSDPTWNQPSTVGLPKANRVTPNSNSTLSRLGRRPKSLSSSSRLTGHWSFSTAVPLLLRSRQQHGGPAARNDDQLCNNPNQNFPNGLRIKGPWVYKTQTKSDPDHSGDFSPWVVRPAKTPYLTWSG